MATTEEQLDTLFGKLDTQLKNRQTKRALKTTDESKYGDDDHNTPPFLLFLSYNHVPISINSSHYKYKPSIQS